jgi:hypothetical protein
MLLDPLLTLNALLLFLLSITFLYRTLAKAWWSPFLPQHKDPCLLLCVAFATVQQTVIAPVVTILFLDG